MDTIIYRQLSHILQKRRISPTILYSYKELLHLFPGLKLKTEDIKDAMRSAHVFIIALISSLFITGSVVAGITGQVMAKHVGILSFNDKAMLI